MNVAVKQPNNLDYGDKAEVCTDALDLRTVLISLSTQLNVTGRWISSQFADLEQYGGFAAASDCFASADVLLEIVKQWSDQLEKMEISMPSGIGYVRSQKPGSTGQ
jgi:hypothetical protein